MTRTSAPRARRAVLATVLPALAVVLGVLAPVTPATAAAAPVPAPKAMPAAIEALPGYQGARLCDPVAHSGPKALQALLTKTYGTTSYGITRSCSGSTGTSEHQEGRALDWMISGKAQKADAKAFLAWLLATDGQGNTYAMARRMGIMYIVWDDRMFRLYDTSRGWAEYQDCSSHPGASYDTTCHRNHVHFSFTWDGATARTSYWSGAAVTAPDCPRAGSVSAPAAVTTSGLEFVPLPPARILDTAAGVGVAARCRLTQDAWVGDNRRIDLQVSGQGGVPAAGAVAVALAVQVEAPNAPTLLFATRTGTTSRLRVSSTAMTADGLGASVTPLGTGGKVTLTLSTGAADVTADVLGYYRVADGTGQRYHPVTPARVPNPGPLAPGESRTVQVAGLAGVPASGATAVTVAMTLWDPPQAGGATVYGSDDPAPAAGQLSVSAPAGGRRTNTLVTRLGADGTVVVRNDSTGPRTVNLDVQGWWADAAVAGGSVYRVLAPKEVVDTTEDRGITDALKAGTPASVQVAGVAGVPASGATAVALQTTALAPSALTSVVAWPAGLTQPAVRSASINKGKEHTALLVATLRSGKVALAASSGTLGTRSYAVGYWYQP